MENFKLLDCFDCNIENLDLTINYIYVLKLEEDKYYVGRTSNILIRIEQHFKGEGAIFTKAFKPIKVIELSEELTKQDERNKTLEYMEKYGWQNVRGFVWCSLEIREPNIKINAKNKPKEVKPIVNDIDIELCNLYCNENKSIIEISKIINKTAGFIANRLEKLCIVKRKQLSKGYFEYIQSELYKIDIEKRALLREQKKCKLETTSANSNLLNIKKIIKEKYFTSK